MRALPTLRQLRYLVALSEHRHFGKAAQACLVTQSTMSASIQELETLLGCTLVERDRRHVVLTPLGQTVVKRAESLLRDAHDLIDAVSAAQAPFSTPLRLGVIPTIAPFFLPRFLPSLRERYPSLQLVLHEDLSERLADRLKAGELDVLLLALPWPIEGVEEMILGDDPFLLAVPPNHRLAKRKVVDWDDIAPSELLLMAEGHCLRDHVLTACNMAGIKAGGNGVLGTSLHTIIQMVAGDLGITLLPKMAEEAGLSAAAGLCTCKISDGTAGRQIGLVWRSSSSRTEELRILGRFFAEALANGEESDENPSLLRA